MFLYEREHLDDAPALVPDLLSTVHENRPWKVEEIHHWKLSEQRKREKKPSTYWEDNGFSGIEGGGW